LGHAFIANRTVRPKELGKANIALAWAVKVASS